MQKDNTIFLNTEEQNEDNEDKSCMNSSSGQDEDRNYSPHHYTFDSQQIQNEKKRLINERKQNEEDSDLRQRKTTSYSLPQKINNKTQDSEVSGRKRWVSKNINQINLAEIGQVYESKQAYADWMNQIENSKMVKIDFESSEKKEVPSQLNAYFSAKIKKMDNQLMVLKKKIINEQKFQYYTNVMESQKKVQGIEVKKKLDIPYHKQLSLDEDQRKKNQEEILKKCDKPDGFFKYKSQFNYLQNCRTLQQKTNPYKVPQDKRNNQLKNNYGKSVDLSSQNVRQYSQIPKFEIDKVFDENFYPRKNNKIDPIINSHDMQNTSLRQNESPKKSKKLMHTLDRRLQYLSKVHFKDQEKNIDTQNMSEFDIPQSARYDAKYNQGSFDFPQFNSVILPNINSDKKQSQKHFLDNYQKKKEGNIRDHDFEKKFILQEEFLDGYNISGQEVQSYQCMSPVQQRHKFTQNRSNSKQKRSPTNSNCSIIRQSQISQAASPIKLLDLRNSLADQDSSILYEHNYDSALSLNYQGKPLEYNQARQIPSIINELSTMIDGTFKEGKKFDDPSILQTFYKSTRQIIEIDLAHLQEEKLERNNKNKVQQFNEKIDSLKDKILKLKDIEIQISKTLSINDDMQQSQIKLDKIKKQFDKTLDNLDFFIQILEQYDYPESRTSMIMLKMKQNEYKDIIELQQQSASDYRDSMLDPTNLANNMTAYRNDRIKKIKDLIRQKKIRNASKITNI